MLFINLTRDSKLGKKLEVKSIKHDDYKIIIDSRDLISIRHAAIVIDSKTHINWLKTVISHLRLSDIPVKVVTNDLDTFKKHNSFVKELVRHNAATQKFINETKFNLDTTFEGWTELAPWVNFDDDLVDLSITPICNGIHPSEYIKLYRTRDADCGVGTAIKESLLELSGLVNLGWTILKENNVDNLMPMRKGSKFIIHHSTSIVELSYIWLLVKLDLEPEIFILNNDSVEPVDLLTVRNGNFFGGALGCLAAVEEFEVAERRVSRLMV